MRTCELDEWRKMGFLYGPAMSLMRCFTIEDVCDFVGLCERNNTPRKIPSQSFPHAYFSYSIYNMKMINNADSSGNDLTAFTSIITCSSFNCSYYTKRKSRITLL